MCDRSFSCARRQTRLAERAGQKIMSQRQLPDLRMQGCRVDGWFRIRLGRGPEHACGAFKKLITPLLDLIGAPIKVLSQLDQGLFPLIAATATFALNAGLWFRRGRLAMVISSLAAIMLPWRGKSTYPGCSVFPNRLFQRPRSG
jgi:hypothetical protein